MVHQKKGRASYFRCDAPSQTGRGKCGKELSIRTGLIININMFKPFSNVCIIFLGTCLFNSKISYRKFMSLLYVFTTLSSLTYQNSKLLRVLHVLIIIICILNLSVHHSTSIYTFLTFLDYVLGCTIIIYVGKVKYVL